MISKTQTERAERIARNALYFWREAARLEAKGVDSSKWVNTPLDMALKIERSGFGFVMSDWPGSGRANAKTKRTA